MARRLKILYQIPSIETVYAARFIYQGYRDAFLDLGYQFKPLTSNMDPKKVFLNYKPDIFITGISDYAIKFLDLEVIFKLRKKGMVMFPQIYTWKRVNNQFGGEGLQSNPKLVDLIKKGMIGDVFTSWLHQGDPLMYGFTKNTGFPVQTILLAANKKMYYPDFDEKFKTDISFVGSFLPDKRQFIKKHLIPLTKKYQVRVYGSDWTLTNKMKGYIQKAGQYFNIGLLKDIRKLNISEGFERRIYSSSTISLNIHEDHQRKFGSDFNERTFKIIASGGFEICDNVRELRRYFDDKELVIAENSKDWFLKIDYFLKNPGKRLAIIKAGRKKVIEKHTYHNRAQQYIDIYENFQRGKIK